MKPQANRLEKDLVRAAFDFYGHRPWKEIDSNSLFLVRVPSEELPLVASVIGAGGEEYGLILARGECAMKQFASFILKESEGQRFGDVGDLLSISFDGWASVSDDYRRLIERAGQKPRRERMVPVIFVSPPHREPHPPGRIDMRTLLLVLRGLNAALADGVLKPKFLDSGSKRIVEVEIKQAGRKASYVSREVDWPESAIDVPPLLMLPRDLENFPSLQERWLFARLPLPGRIGDDDRLPFVLLLATEDGPIHGSGIAMGADLSGAAELVAESVRGNGKSKPQPGLPRAILFDDHLLHAALAPALAGLGITTDVDPESDAISDLLDVFAEKLPKPEFELQPGSLEAWKAAELETGRLLATEIMEKDFFAPRARKRYFGDAEDGEDVLVKLENFLPHAAFVEWIAADYRVTVRSKTLVEKLLAKKRLAPEIRTLLKARQSARISVYRVNSREPGLSLDVEDIFDGERFTVIDKALSGCELDGSFLPLRLMNVREWVFSIFAGPPMTAFQVRSMLDSVVRPGTDLSSTIIKNEPQILGYLWSALLHWRPPHLTNTDGDELENQSATFRVVNMKKLLAFLDQHPEMDYDEPEGTWAWFREVGPVAIGRRTLLGRLSLIDESLLLEANSVARLDRARSWLEASGHVTFDSVTTSDFHSDQRPLDDRLPSEDDEPSPEMIEALQAMMLEHYKGWADEPIPMLGNLTPRTACKSAKGRRKVEQLVRTMPDMQTPSGPIPVPRDEILIELGIISER